MSWHLMTILPTPARQTRLCALAAYLGGSDGAVPKQVLWQLCQKVADLFDQYLVHRPDWIARWEGGRIEPGAGRVSGQDWQPELWRELVARTWPSAPAATTAPASTRPGIHGWRAPGSARRAALQRVFVFGISALPPRYVEALLALGSRPEVEVHLFVTNPCRYYWGGLLDRKTLARFETSSSPARISRPCRALPTSAARLHGQLGATTCTS